MVYQNSLNKTLDSPKYTSYEQSGGLQMLEKNSIEIRMPELE